MVVSKTSDHIQHQIKIPNPNQEPPASSNGCSWHLQKQVREPILGSGVYIQIIIEVPKSNQEPPASSKAPKQDLKDMDALSTFKIKIEI